MLKVKDFFECLKKNNTHFFCGVPDSLLKDFCAYVTDNVDDKYHTITANEGNAIGLASGHYLATGNPAVVYMQNSGIGNCVNPLISLTDEEVYNIPLLLLIGWRGEPTKPDEPQHIKQGKVTDKLLEVMGIKYEILPSDFSKAEISINNAFKYMEETKKPFAFIIQKGIFEKYSLINKKENSYTLRREEAIESVLKELDFSDIIVSTTGHISREVYETRNRLEQTHKQDFLTVGSMGHSSSIALGIALEKPERNVYCFDGDGAFLMHMGSVVVNASKNLENFKHIIFNNEAHDSVGAQPTSADCANLAKLALSAGYKKSFSVETKEDLINVLPEFINLKAPALLEIKVKCGAREDLGRPKEKPIENKNIFMENLKQVEFCYHGAIENLSAILKKEKAKKILVFSGKKSFESIKPIFNNQVQNSDVTYYNNFSVNPKKEEVDIAIKNIGSDFDIIVAIGGGSVIDFAKAYKYYSSIGIKLIAIPTTAGTGSEATQFSVIYINGVKFSLDEPEILPEYAIIDSQFVENSPKYLKACCALDTFCHAIESYWATKSTIDSRAYAKKAMTLCRENIVEYVNSDNKKYAANMAKASNLAGKAINISRTTAAHALSYKITSSYNIPHGHAAALSMKDLFIANQNITKENCTDKRGYEFVQDRINEILEILKITSFENYWLNLLNQLEIEYDFKKLNISNKAELIASVNKERLKNNPKNIENELKDFWKGKNN